MFFSFKNITRLGKVLYPSLLWNLPEKEKVLYLTFDDGPIPEVTPWVLSLLKKYNAKATFFCIGDNVEKNPDTFAQVLAEGHTTGNHTFNHLNGWKTLNSTYIQNVLLAEEVLLKNREARGKRQETGSRESNYSKRYSDANNLEKSDANPLTHTSGSKQGKDPGKHYQRKLFRPPYGRIKPSQIKHLKQLGYEIVMWEVVSMDFDRKIPAEHCFKIVTENAKPGSIIIFHDSLKAEKNLKIVLPEVLEYYSRKGYSFKSL